jgi:hypothetical protein
MYFPDLDLCHYHRGPLDADRWAVPLRAIGWLEHPHSYATGALPGAFTARLAELIAQTGTTFSHYGFRGLHGCDLCSAAGAPAFYAPESCDNVFIPGEGEVFAATGAILHYIEAHSYCPPASFVRAVLACPPVGSAEYLAALRHANKGQDIPLLTKEEAERQSAVSFMTGYRFIEQLGGPAVPTEFAIPSLEKMRRLFDAHVEDPEQVRRRAEVAQRFRAALGRELIGAARADAMRAAQSAQPDWVASPTEGILVLGPATIYFGGGTVRDAVPNLNWHLA